jgi:hypothetical protein
MINPKTLKAGEVVIFGGKVEKMVKAFYPNTTTFPYVHFEKDAYIYSLEDPIWQIAELKKPELPDLKIVGFHRDGTGYFCCFTNSNYTVGEVLAILRLNLEKLSRVIEK